MAGLTDNLVAYWTMDEASGNRADSTANAHTLTDNNTVAAAAGILNNGADFELTNGNEALSVADHADFDFSTAMSWQAWVKIEALVAGAHAIISKFVGGSQASYMLRHDGDGTVSLLIPDALTDVDDSDCPRAGISSALVAGTLYHLVMIYDGTLSGNANRLKLYINNVLQTLSFTGTIPASLQDSTAAVVIGLEALLGTYEYDGIIDEVGAWSRALTADDVRVLYNGGVGIPYPLSSGGYLGGKFF
mgnify:CR=1 FL=1